MNQIEKTEMIIGLIAIAKSKLIAKIFIEKKVNTSNLLFITNTTKKLKYLESLLRTFYKKLEISDQEYKQILRKIKRYE